MWTSSDFTGELHLHGQVGRTPVAVLLYGSYYLASRTYVSYDTPGLDRIFWWVFLGSIVRHITRVSWHWDWMQPIFQCLSSMIRAGIRLSRPCCVVQGNLSRNLWLIFLKAQSRITIPFVIHIHRQMGTPVPAAPQLCSIIPSPDALPAGSR